MRIPQRVEDTTAEVDEQLEQLKSAYAKASAADDAAVAVVEQAESVLDVAKQQASAAFRDIDRYMRSARSRT